MELTEREQEILLVKAARSVARKARKEFRKIVLELEIKPDMVFQSMTMDKNKSRRIIGVGNGYCIYSDGGDSNRECQLKTLRNWIVYTRAKWNG